MNERYITVWREADAVFDWDFYVSESLSEASRAVANLVDQGVRQFTTYPINNAVKDLSSGHPK